MNRIIAHLDMDAFFAAVEEKDNPQFKGCPIVVGADPKGGQGRGVVATANYKARAYGIHSAMPITKAWALAQEAIKKGLPQTIFLPGNGKRYSQISDAVMRIFKKEVPIMEQTSIDEAFGDLTFIGSFEKAERLCRKIKKEVIKSEGLTASVGLGPNRLIAKIASGRQKPDGLTVVTPEMVESFLEPLNIRELPGIGPKTEIAFKKLGISRIREIKKFTLAEMKSKFGKWGMDLYYKSRGIDEAPVGQEWVRQSIGEQVTLEEDTLDPNILLPLIKDIVESVFGTLLKTEFETFKRVVLTVRFEDFKTFSRSRTLDLPTGAKQTLEQISLKLFLPFLDARENRGKKRIRLLGVRIEELL